MGDNVVDIVYCPSFFSFNSSTKRNTRYMRASVMLKLKKDSYLKISPGKLRIKQSKFEEEDSY